ncbi:hypothetical protein G7Y89_g2895 [Cudoniella acicularis]|uniref:Uncharacterized protein n=1 Tax=Cudoniella acicularis TaxID=354080 RepID=A0A8H4W8X5_9HELO|nr:hypothetical protein G7Y89_g2895 [Cudoniella acicularis]
MSKLTDEALALHGGCDCTSIKYTIFIPPVSSRPVLTPSSENNNLGPILAPKIFFDHCNKCRRVSGAILQAWLSCPQTWVCWSLSSTHDNDRISLSTSEILKEHTAVSGIISHYESSPGLENSLVFGIGIAKVLWDFEATSNLLCSVACYASTWFQKTTNHLGASPNNYCASLGVDACATVGYRGASSDDGYATANDGRAAPEIEVLPRMMDVDETSYTLLEAMLEAWVTSGADDAVCEFVSPEPEPELYEPTRNELMIAPTDGVAKLPSPGFVDIAVAGPTLFEAAAAGVGFGDGVAGEFP